MTRPVLKNPYVYIMLGPLVLFILAVWAGVEPDQINVAGRLYVFGLMAYSAARYVGHAPVLMWQGDMTPEARNVTGWALFLMAIMGQMAYGALVISLDRPAWLLATYWSAALVVLAGVGMTLVASSVPRFPFPPFGKGDGYGVATSFLVGFLSAVGLFMVQHVPALLKLIGAFFSGLTHAV